MGITILNYPIIELNESKEKFYNLTVFYINVQYTNLPNMINNSI